MAPTILTQYFIFRERNRNAWRLDIPLHHEEHAGHAGIGDRVGDRGHDGVVIDGHAVAHLIASKKGSGLLAAPFG